MKIRGIDAKIAAVIAEKMNRNITTDGEVNTSEPTIIKVDGEQYGGAFVLVDKVEFYTEAGIVKGAISGELCEMASVATIDCG